MDGTTRLFLYPRRAEIARTIYNLCHSEYEECDAANVMQHAEIADLTYDTVLDAIQSFEDRDWVTRHSSGRTNHITLTDRGDTVFTALVRLLEVLEQDDRYQQSTSDRT